MLLDDHGPLHPMESGGGLLKLMDTTHLYSGAQDDHSMAVLREENVRKTWRASYRHVQYVLRAANIRPIRRYTLTHGENTVAYGMHTLIQRSQCASDKLGVRSPQRTTNLRTFASTYNKLTDVRQQSPIFITYLTYEGRMGYVH